MPPPVEDSSVSAWLIDLKAGNRDAAQKLWERYFRRLVGLARAKLGTLPNRVANEEDVALSVFDSFCRRAENNLFPQLADRDNLWHLLLAITERKSINLRNHVHAQKRGPGTAPKGPEGLEGIATPEPSPEFATEFAEQVQWLLELLGDEELRHVAVWKMEGYTNGEIADKLHRSLQAVSRKIKSIKEIWTQAGVRL